MTYAGRGLVAYTAPKPAMLCIDQAGMKNGREAPLLGEHVGAAGTSEGKRV